MSKMIIEYRGFDIIFKEESGNYVGVSQGDKTTFYSDKTIHGVQREIDEYWDYDDSRYYEEDYE